MDWSSSAALLRANRASRVTVLPLATVNGTFNERWLRALISVMDERVVWRMNGLSSERSPRGAECRRINVWIDGTARFS